MCSFVISVTKCVWKSWRMFRYPAPASGSTVTTHETTRHLELAVLQLHPTAQHLIKGRLDTRKSRLPHTGHRPTFSLFLWAETANATHLWRVPNRSARLRRRRVQILPAPFFLRLQQASAPIESRFGHSRMQTDRVEDSRNCRKIHRRLSQSCLIAPVRMTRLQPKRTLIHREATP